MDTVSEKKPGRASKICDKPRNVQILVHAKFQPNRTIIGSQVIHGKILCNIRGNSATLEGGTDPKHLDCVCGCDRKVAKFAKFARVRNLKTLHNWAF